MTNLPRRTRNHLQNRRGAARYRRHESSATSSLGKGSDFANPRQSLLSPAPAYEKSPPRSNAPEPSAHLGILAGSIEQLHRSYRHAKTPAESWDASLARLLLS